MRIVVTGATGNVGTSVIAALDDTPQVTSVVGVARRLPEPVPGGKVTYVAADLVEGDLRGTFAGASAVIHLAWAIQPSRDEQAMRRTNVVGTERVLEAAAAAKVGAVVHASSLGAYSAGPKERAVDETWPTHGILTSAYSRHKAYVERMLDAFAATHPEIRVVPIRPALILKHGAASEMVRLFVNPVLPPSLVGRLPIMPDVPGMRFQVLHSHDAGRAIALAAIRPVRGPFNIAAEPVLDSRTCARMLGAVPVRMPARVLRAAAAAAWRAHLTPTDPGWVDMILDSPLMDTSRARDELGWEPMCSANDAFVDLRDGLRESAGMDTKPLAPAARH